MAEAMPSDPKRCVSTRRGGSPCGAAPLPGSAYCFAHDPEKAAERAAARERGGRNSAAIVRMRGLVPPRLVGVYDRLEKALADVETGALDPKQATAMAALSRAMVAVLQAGELEERVRNLEGRQAS